MPAYYNSTTLKFELLFEVSEHQRFDRYIQGEYWDGSKGCLIGCLAPLKEDRHQYLSKVYNIPITILSLGDSIFEGLNVRDSLKWPMELLSSIKEGQDLSQVWPKFAYWMLVDDFDGVINLVKDEDLIKNIHIIAGSVLNGSENSSIAKKAAWEVRLVGASGVAGAAGAARAARAAWLEGVVGVVGVVGAVGAARAAWLEGVVGVVGVVGDVEARNQANKLVEIIQGEQ